MKYLIFSLWLIFLSSCSTLKKQKLYSGLLGGLVGAAVGAQLGKNLSPNKESVKLNQSIGFGAGASSGFIIGSFLGGSFWESSPKNMQKDHLFFNHKEDHQKKEKTKIKVLRPKNPEKIKLKSKLPDFLKGKVKEANLMTYEIEDYQEEMDDGRIIYHEKHKAYEYVLE